MREPSFDVEKKEILLKKCFEYMIESGLESISLRKLCEDTGMSMSSAYYWFENKEGMILNAAEWGFKKVTGNLFEFIYKYFDNLECSIITFTEVAMKYKKEIHFIYQVVTSKKYGDKIRPIANRISLVYEEYAQRLAEHLHVGKYEVMPYVHLLISSVLDYVIWNDKEKIEMELACVYKAICNLSNNKE